MIHSATNMMMARTSRRTTQPQQPQQAKLQDHKESKTTAEFLMQPAARDLPPMLEVSDETKEWLKQKQQLHKENKKTAEKGGERYQVSLALKDNAATAYRAGYSFEDVQLMIAQRSKPRFFFAEQIPTCGLDQESALQRSNK